MELLSAENKQYFEEWILKNGQTKPLPKIAYEKPTMTGHQAFQVASIGHQANDIFLNQKQAQHQFEQLLIDYRSMPDTIKRSLRLLSSWLGHPYRQAMLMYDVYGYEPCSTYLTTLYQELNEALRAD